MPNSRKVVVSARGTPPRWWSDVSLRGRPSTGPEPAARLRYLEYLPVGLFASVMGLAGLAIAWRRAAAIIDVPHWIGVAVSVVALATFVALCLAYGMKVVLARDAVRAEFAHPVTGNLFGTIIVSILLLSIILTPVTPYTARAMWWGGAVAMLGFGWLIMDRLLGGRQQVAHATPAWIVPIVGILNVPLAPPPVDLLRAHALLVAALSIGLFFAIPLFTVILARLVFEPATSNPPRPLLLILVAPFAVGFSAYVSTTGQVDLFAQGLYGLMLFLLAILVGRLRDAAHCCPFRVAWWAVSFPLAAAAVAAIRFAEARPGGVSEAVALLLLAVATLVVAGLSVRTLAGIVRGELRALS